MQDQDADTIQTGTEQAQPDQALIVRPLPAIKTIVVGHLELEKFQASLLTAARRQVAVKRAALQEAQQGMAAAQAADASEQYRRWRYRYMARRRPSSDAEKYLSALEEGYLPIPRIPTLHIDYVRGAIPPEALMALAEAKASGLFDYFVVADGREATDYHVSLAKSHAHRDPILLGVTGRE